MRTPRPSPPGPGGPGLAPPRLGAAAALAVFGGVAAACTVETEVGIEHPDVHTVARVPPTFRTSLDLLFVVDDTAGAAPVQADAALLWRRLRDHLAYAEHGFPSVRIGVVSSDVGVEGVDVPGCTATGRDGVLVPGPKGGAWFDVDPLAPHLADFDLDARLALGEGGCAYAQPLRALVRALDDQPRNDGFLRRDTALAVVFVSGDDDCSFSGPLLDVPGDGPLDTFRCFREGVYCAGDDVRDDVKPGDRQDCAPRDTSDLMPPVTPLAGWLGKVKDDPSAAVASGLVGDPDRVSVVVVDENAPTLATACTSGERAIYPAIRLGAFVAATGGSTDSACGPPATATAASSRIGHDLRRVLGHRCVEGALRDIEPAEPGLQVECEAHAIDGARRTRLPACANPMRPFGEPGPCYALVRGAPECGDFPSQLAVQVNWGGATPTITPPGVWTEVACAIDESGPIGVPD